MRKNLLRIFILMIAIGMSAPAYAQFISQWTQGIVPLPATPAVCVPGNGQIIYNTATNGALVCTAVNTWRPLGVTGNSFDLAQGIITAQDPALNTTATWNNVAITFTHWTANITDTASAAVSLLLDLQVGGASQFNVTKAGRVTATGEIRAGADLGFTIFGRSRFQSASDGRVHFTDNAGTGAAIVTFGPETNAFVRITPISVGGVGQGFIFGHGDGTTVVFADLAAATNGTVVYCSDCTKATPCAAAGNGALAKRLNGAWDCD